MKLDRNIYPMGRGKYALIKVRKLREQSQNAEKVKQAIELLEREGILDWGDGDDDFFVIRLKDENAWPALDAYAQAYIRNNVGTPDGGMEFASEVRELANKALRHPRKKKPD